VWHQFPPKSLIQAECVRVCDTNKVAGFEEDMESPLDRQHIKSD